MADFPSTPLPSYPIDETCAEPDVLISQHRDGTEQRRYRGAGKGRIFKVPYGTSAPITNGERLNIMSHHIGQRGTTDSFDWHHPERGETIHCRYLSVPTFRHVGYGFYEGSVELQEVPA